MFTDLKGIKYKRMQFKLSLFIPACWDTIAVNIVVAYRFHDLEPQSSNKKTQEIECA